MAQAVAEVCKSGQDPTSDSDEKLSLASAGKPLDDRDLVEEVEALEERLQSDEGTDDEYRIVEAYEVALKVST